MLEQGKAVLLPDPAAEHSIWYGRIPLVIRIKEKIRYRNFVLFPRLCTVYICMIKYLTVNVCWISYDTCKLMGRLRQGHAILTTHRASFTVGHDGLVSPKPIPNSKKFLIYCFAFIFKLKKLRKPHTGSLLCIRCCIGNLTIMECRLNSLVWAIIKPLCWTVELAISPGTKPRGGGWRHRNQRKMDPMY